MTLPSVSAVVVTYNTGPRLREALHALNAEPSITEILIVNNGLPEDSRDWLARFEAKSTTPIHVDDTGENLGFAAGVNRGAAQARSDRLLIINPDAVLKTGSLAALEIALEGQARPTLVGGRLFYPSGREQRGGRRRLLTLPRAMLSYTGLYALWRRLGGDPGRQLHLEHAPSPESPIPMDVVSGALMYIRTDDYRALGGFDEAYFLHVEDIELCRRIAEKGGSVIYTPDAAALHYGSTSTVSRAFIEHHKARGLATYFKTGAANGLERVLVHLSIPVFFTLLLSRSKLIEWGWNIRRWLRRRIG